MSIKSNNKNSYRWKQYIKKRQKLASQHPLRYLFLEITRRCNYKCIYCGSDCSVANPTQELSTKTWIDIIHRISKDFDPQDIMVAVTGGEPLVRKDTLDIFSELRRLGFPFGLVTNGSLVTSCKAEQIVASGIGSISLSLDAPQVLNDALRGNGATKNVENAIRLLKEAGYRGILEIISTVTKPVVPVLNDLRKTIAQMRVASWRLAPVIPIGRATNRADLLLDATDVRILLEFIAKAVKDPFRPQPEMSEEGYLGDRYEGNVRPYLCRCDAGLTVGGILYDGRIGACPELTDTFVQGHILHDTFKNVWENRYQNLRDRSWTQKDQCASCDAYEVCLGGSMHLYRDTQSPIARCLYLMLDGQTGIY